MKTQKLSFKELVKKNKEELLRDREEIVKIEKRLDEKHVKAN